MQRLGREWWIECLYLFQGLSKVMGWGVEKDIMHFVEKFRWVESLVVEDDAHSMEEFKQSVEWFRRLYTLRFWGVKWRVKAQGVGGGGGCKLSHQWGGCTIHLSCRWVVEEVIQFIWVRGGWWRRLYSLWRRLYSFVEEVIHPVEEVIHTLVIIVSAQSKEFGFGVF